MKKRKKNIENDWNFKAFLLDKEEVKCVLNGLKSSGQIPKLKNKNKNNRDKNLYAVMFLYGDGSSELKFCVKKTERGYDISEEILNYFDSGYELKTFADGLNIFANFSPDVEDL